MKADKTGFTLAELLIVVAIIGILVAVSIPIFNKQVEKAREAHDIATMRAAASAAIELYYAGVNEKNAEEFGMKWWNPPNGNAAGVYDPRTGKFCHDRDSLGKVDGKWYAYGQGTKTDAGTSFVLGNDRGAYNPELDYTQAVVMVSIYPPQGTTKGHVEVYWKYNNDFQGKKRGNYVGDQHATSIPKYSISIPLN